MKKLITISFLLLTVFTLQAQEQPNVLMIVLDDLNNFVGVMGGHPQAKTPNIDKLADEGVLFNNAHSNAPICIASRASFMTGVSPITSKFWGFGNWLKNDMLMNSKTLPEYFRENGYQTIQTGKVFHANKKGAYDNDGIVADYGPMAYNGKKAAIHPSNPPEMLELGPLDATFAPLSDVPDVKAATNTPGYSGWYNTHRKTKGPFHYNSEEDRDLLTDEKSAQWAVENLQKLASKNNGEPFFMSVGFIRPHTPLVVPQKYFDMFPLDEVQIPFIKKNDREDTKLANNSDKESRGRKAYRTLTESSLYSDADEALRTYTQAYLASIAFADDMVGIVLDALENSTFKDNTVVVLFSDHGYNIGEKEYLFKYALWEQSTQVPLIIRHPLYRETAGSKVSHPVGLIDIYPTLAEIAALKGETKISTAGAGLNGFSLVDFLKDPNAKWQGPDVAISVITSWRSKEASKQHLSVRSKDYRYTRYLNGDEELYDHTNDPHEWNNLANDKQYKKIKAALAKQLEAELERLAP